MSNIIPIKRAPTDKRSRSDTLIITQAVYKSWHSPPFQRPLRENEKVRALTEELKRNGGVLPGVITLGQFKGSTYIIDGPAYRRIREVFTARLTADGAKNTKLPAPPWSVGRTGG